MSISKIYKCPLCGFEGYKRTMVKHMYEQHYNYMIQECTKYHLENDGEAIKCLAICLSWGLTKFECCPKCGKPFLKFSDPRRFPVSRICECGYNHRNEEWKKSMKEWLNSPLANDHRKQSSELGKQYGKINGPKNFKKYCENMPIEERLRRSERGKINGPKNLYKYNHDPSYKNIRSERAKKAAETRELNEEFVKNRALKSALITSKRKEGNAQLYIIKCIEKKRNFSCVKVGYSRNYKKFRKQAYTEFFEIIEENVFDLTAKEVIEFEQFCSLNFDHYYPAKYPHNIGRTEWYWGKDYENILNHFKNNF